MLVVRYEWLCLRKIQTKFCMIQGLGRIGYMMLERLTNATLEEVKWSDVRDSVIQVNPAMPEKIDALKPGKDFTLYKARYPFGCMILNKSTFYLPHEGKLLSLHDNAIPQKLKEALSYGRDIAASVPLGLCITHTAELYMQQEDRVIPFSFFTPEK